MSTINKASDPTPPCSTSPAKPLKHLISKIENPELPVCQSSPIKPATAQVIPRINTSWEIFNLASF